MQIWKNSFFVFLSLAIRAITNFLIGVGVFRFYGIEAFGQFSIAFNVANMCLIIADFGFDVLLTTEIANNRNRAGEIARKYFSIKLVLASIASVVMISVLAFLPLSTTSKSLILVLVVYMVFTTLSNFFFAFFRGFEKFEYETRIAFITNLVLLGALAFFGWLKLNLIYLMVAFVIVRFVGIVLSAPLSYKLAGTRIFSFDLRGTFPLIKKVFVFGLSFLFGNLFFQLDTLLIGVWLGDVSAGIYRSAFYIMVMMLMIPDIAISSSLPKLSRAFVDNKERWEYLSRVIYKFLLILALPICIITFFYPELILTIIYGKIESPDTITILKIFAIILFIRFVVEPFGLMLTTSNRQFIRMFIVISATLISFILNYIYVFKNGLLSVAYVSLVVNMFVGLAYISFSAKIFLKWIFELRNILILLYAGLLFILLFITNASFISLAFCFITFPLFVYTFGFIKEERNEIISSLPITKFRIAR